MPENIDGRASQKESTKVEEAKKKLYSKYATVKERPRARMHAHKQNLATDWETPEGEPKQPAFSEVHTSAPIFRKVFIVSAVFFGIALAVAAISLFGGRNIVSTDAIDMEIITNSFVDGGQTFTATVSITNQNAAPLELAEIVFIYPKSSVEDGEMVRDRRLLDTINSGQTVYEDFPATLFGEEGDERKLNAKFEYRVQGSNAIFVKEVEKVVAIQSTPVQVSLNAPNVAVNNQPLVLDFEVQSNSTEITENMVLRVEYPTGFRFDEAEPQPSFDNNIWILGDLEPSATREIRITGNMRGQTGEERTFRAFVGEQDQENEKEIITSYNSVIHVVSINKSFIGAEIAIDGSTEDPVPIDSGVESSVEVVWTNTLPVRLDNVEVIAMLSGSAYNPATVSARGGFFDSISNEVRWDRSTTTSLSSADPGESGSLFFDFTPRPLVSGSSVIDKPEFDVQVSVRGINPSGEIQEASGIIQKRAVVNSDLQLTPKTLYYSGPFSSSGSFPPKVGEMTTFNINWTVTNSSNKVTGTRVTTTLPSYVEWLNTYTPNTENLSYNSVKREITWNLGEVDSGVGFNKEARNVTFKVGITPSLSQVGSAPDLTADVVLSGDDMFTNSFLRQIRKNHSTRLLNDVQPGKGEVEE